MEQIDTEATPPPRCSGSLPSDKSTHHSDEAELENDATPAEKRKNWRLFRRKKKGSTTSIVSKKSMFTIRRRRNRKKVGSENFVQVRKVETDLGELRVSHQLLERTQRSKSFGSEGRLSRLNNRVRSNSSYKTNKPNRRARKKREHEEKERKKSIAAHIKACLDNLCTALVENDKELFTSIFTDDEPRISHPVGMLVETDLASYFKHFVEAYAMVDPILAPGSVVLDLTNLSAHCEVTVASKYVDGKDAVVYEEPQHWHFNFEIHGFHPPSLDGSPLKSSDAIELEKEPIEVVIKRWHVYSSLSRYQILDSRKVGDYWKSSMNWITLGRKYGVSYVGSQLVEAFSTEKTPPELTQMLKALNSYSPIALEKCFSYGLRAAVIEGLFSYYIAYEKKTRADLAELSQIILKQFDKQKVHQIKCVSVFRCGVRISARLVLNVKRELVPAFLMLRMSGDKNNSANNKVVEMLFCSPNT